MSQTNIIGDGPIDPVTGHGHGGHLECATSASICRHLTHEPAESRAIEHAGKE